MNKKINISIVGTGLMGLQHIKAISKSKTLDAVIVATPNQLHEKHTVSFLKKKIPVLLEKPISDNIN